MDEVDIEEGIIVLVDCSNSMNENSGLEKRAEKDDAAKEYELIKENGWDSNPPKNDSEDATNELVNLLSNHPNIRDFRNLVQSGVSLHDRRFRADRVIQELCRMTWLNSNDEDDVEDRRRCFTKYKDRFIEVLLQTQSSSDSVSEETLDDPDTNPPEIFICPISYSILEDPVIASDGVTYSRADIQEWFQHSLKSPSLGIQLLSTDLRENVTLRGAILEWREKRQRALRARESAGLGTSHQIYVVRGQEKSMVVNCNLVTMTMEEIYYQSLGADADMQPKVLIMNNRQLNYMDIRRRPLSDLGLKNLGTIHIKGEELIGHGMNQGAKCEIMLRNVHCARMKVDIRCDISESFETILFRCFCMIAQAAPEKLNNPNFGPRKWTLWKFEANPRSEVIDGQKVRYGDEIFGNYDSDLCSYWNIRSQADADRFDMEILTRRPFEYERTELTRMEAAQSLFVDYANRSIAYNYPTAIGLITFGSTVNSDECEITLSYEDFIEEVQKLQPDGDTKLFDAIHESADKLLAWKKRVISERKTKAQQKKENQQASKHKDAKDVQLRIVCLSDGIDCKSEHFEAWECAEVLQKNKIVFDLVRIGDPKAQDPQAHGIAKATGGYVFHPRSMHMGRQMMELETMLFAGERPEGFRHKTRAGLELVKDKTTFSRFTQVGRFPLDRCDEHVVPARRKADGLELRIMGAKETETKLLEMEKEEASSSSSALSKTSKKKDIQPAARKRILRDFKNAQRDKNPDYDIYMTEDISFWTVVMDGPKGSLYEDGVFELYMDFPSDYPSKPPTVRFITEMRHCNIARQGRICHSILDRNWNSDQTALDVLNNIYGLLISPESENPLDGDLAVDLSKSQAESDAAAKLKQSDPIASAKALEASKKAYSKYSETVRKSVMQHAMKNTRKQLSDKYQ